MVALITFSLEVLEFMVTCNESCSIIVIQGSRDRMPSGGILAPLEPRRPSKVSPLGRWWWFLFWQQVHHLHQPASFWSDCQQSNPYSFTCGSFEGDQEEVFCLGYGTSIRTMYQPTLLSCILAVPEAKEKLRAAILKIQIGTKVLDTFTLEDSHGVFTKWPENYKCIEVRKSYFEGDFSFVLLKKLSFLKMSQNSLMHYCWKPVLTL